MWFPYSGYDIKFSLLPYEEPQSVSISIMACVFAYNYFSLQYSAFSAAKIACKPKGEQNQVCKVRLIPGLNLVHFWEYGPLWHFILIIWLSLIFFWKYSYLDKKQTKNKINKKKTNKQTNKQTNKLTNKKKKQKNKKHTFNTCIASL